MTLINIANKFMGAGKNIYRKYEREIYEHSCFKSGVVLLMHVGISR